MAMAQKGLGFGQCVERIFGGWTALRLAASNGFGGAYSDEKAEWFVSATVQWFSQNGDLDPIEVEEFLAGIMNAEFDTIVEDGSVEQVASMICRFYDWLKQNNQVEAVNLYNQLKESSYAAGCQRAPGYDSESENDEGEVMEVDGDDNSASYQSSHTEQTEHIPTKRNQYITDDDGWTTKGSRAKRL